MKFKRVREAVPGGKGGRGSYILLGRLSGVCSVVGWGCESNCKREIVCPIKHKRRGL